MGMELQLRQGNFEAHSDQNADLRRGMTDEEAKQIIGAHCIKRQRDDKKWVAKVPPFKASKGKSFFSPDLVVVGTGDCESSDYLVDPKFPVWRLDDVPVRDRALDGA